MARRAVADPSHAETHVNLAISLQNDALVSRSRLADAKRHAEEALSLRGGTGYVKRTTLAKAAGPWGHAGAQHHWALAEGGIREGVRRRAAPAPSVPGSRGSSVLRVVLTDGRR